ncbi:unnamed protein product [Nippostrongylus brasiliensis]|uniref:Uncharacterized protein n=1 Tax=Nippostrongylus brasiliensis TaxID=27835 RepID=A0A0N4YEI3_NIPBR|nr:unnamed protein product [Nippostrongylus brasiliensis]
MQLFLATAIVLVSDGTTAQPASSLQCEYIPFPLSVFCPYVNRAHERNQEALNLLNEDFAKNSTKRLTAADRLVKDLLTKKDREELHSLLKRALKAELGALTLAKADCYSLPKDLQLSKEETCTKAFEDIAYSIIKLIEASIELETDKSKTTEFEKKLQQTFPQGNPSKNFTNEAYAIGREALTVLW